MKKTLLCLTLAGLLSACGGSDNDSSSSPNPSPSNTTKTGVLTDGPVSGATYTINGVSKRTNAQGEFEYQEGDEITFSIGNIEIGTVTGADRITPVELADDVTTRTNLLIFLQSLDSEGDHDDGIQIPDSVSELDADSIDFSKSTTEFITSFQPVLQKIEIFKDKVVVSATEAQANFNQTLLKDIVGVWYAKNAESEIVLQVTSDGKYLIGEPIVSSPSDSANGMEYGELSVNAVAGELWAQSSIDTNEDWGLNDFGKKRDMKISFDGTQLKISEAQNLNESATFTKVPHHNSGIVGAWSSSSGKQLFVFNTDNTYIMVDAVGDDQVEVGETPCGGPGIEYGNYQLQNGKLLVNTPPIIDTNGCAGLSDNDAHLGLPVTIATNSLTFTVSDEGSFTLSRLNGKDTEVEDVNQTFLKDIAGVWYAKNEESEVVLQITKDGKYMLGEPIFSAPSDSANGMEYGELSIDAKSGTLRAQASIDTNEDWGLTDFGVTRDMKISLNGTELKISEAQNPNESATFTKFPRHNSGIIGAWSSSSGKQLFVFKTDNTYTLIDAVGDDQVEAGETPCGGPGIEYGTYQLQNGKLFVNAIAIDTNGCAGLSDTNAHLGLSGTIGTNTLTFTVSGEGTFTLSRLN
ncbi:hypothetical protein FSC05_10090 [Acinetobacter indicus]|uniref:hypothetical protein n=1 Tax=Acinetobacter indicus TaxID=756892 RepID=UPI0013B092CC|nr:hypothetical protein [Acinetobacter indicus]QIC74030.1 hypothetical protein FSC05_10090 [Acinetobacter indicus]